MVFRKAEKRKAKLRLAITGASGAGKTYGALLVAFGIGGKVALIDTENGSGDLYATLGDYDVCTISAPYTVQKYIAAIKEAESIGYDTIIIDSLSHAWSGEGGLLDLQGQITASSRSGNSYAAWREVTPLHNKLIETILASSCHIIATMRSKTEYVQTENERGRKEIRKVGTAPVQREGMDYEFTTVFDLSINHTASVSKDRTGIFDGQLFTLSEDTGRILKNWLEQGYDLQRVRKIYSGFLARAEGNKEKALGMMKEIIGDTPSNQITEEQMKALETKLTENTTDNVEEIIEIIEEDQETPEIEG